MRLRSLFSSLLLVVSPVTIVAAAQSADYQRNFSISSKTEIPGETLAPGIYSIQLLDHLTDRIVVRVTNTSGGKGNTFLAVNGTGLTGGGDGPVMWAQGTEGRKALRGFRFPNGTAVEFVYPKGQAVAIAKANSDHVIAIDPASEGKVEGKLSSDDMQLVNLWMLTPTKVGPDEGIKAQKYQQVASADTTPNLTGRAPATASAEPAAAAGRSTYSDVPARPRPRRAPVVNKLPHTGSPVSLLYLVGLLSVAGAGLLRVRQS